MKIRQLHYVLEVAKRGLNVTAAAEALFTSQPGVSKQVKLLEDELGVDIFVRNGKHLAEVTPAGKRILEYAEKLLTEADNIRNVAEEFRRSLFLRGYMYDFMQVFAPHLQRPLVDAITGLADPKHPRRRTCRGT